MPTTTVQVQPLKLSIGLGLPTPKRHLSASGYSVELRDKNGNIKSYLTPWVTDVSWTWNRIGGCGDCSITLNKDYRKFDWQARDDIQIRIKDPANPTKSKLVYRGYVSYAIPTLGVPQVIKVQVVGYFGLFKKLIVQTSGSTRTYTNTEVSLIVKDIMNTFVTPNTPIQTGTITPGTFTPDTIQFLTTVDDALNTLFGLSEGYEYGIDQNLNFFWVPEGINVRKRYFAGDDVETFERKINFDALINSAYLVGGTVAGSKFKLQLQNTDSIALYYLSEVIVNNGSITTETVADEYLGNTIAAGSQPQLNMRVVIRNTNFRLEDQIPIGLINIFDIDYDRDLLTDNVGNIIGTAASGGSDITIGIAATGGSDVFVGGEYNAQIDNVQYAMSDTSDRFHATIQFGDTRLLTVAILKRIDNSLANLQQY